MLGWNQLPPILQEQAPGKRVLNGTFLEKKLFFFAEKGFTFPL
jgi:hypothetical protein